MGWLKKEKVLVDIKIKIKKYPLKIENAQENKWKTSVSKQESMFMKNV